LSNAIKFSKKKDKINIEIRFLTQFDQIDHKLQSELAGKLQDVPFGMIEISVKDQGTGIKK